MAEFIRPPPFSDEDFQELHEWLLRRGKAILDCVTLEGFLTAIAIGPNTLSPTVWLPKVWGGREPRFKNIDEFNRFVGLVMGLYNEVVGYFEEDPEAFEPSFFEREVDGQVYVIVDEWCAGFLKGMRLDAPGWKPLKKVRPELLKPMQLFGTRGGWAELEAGGEAAMHAKWSKKIAPAVREIHDFWMPYRLSRRVPGASETRH